MPIIVEGKARITVSNGVFFNPVMKELRDLSVLFLNSCKAKPVTLLDSTAATGIRGIRYYLECGIKDITMLDINRHSYLNAKRNVKLNKLPIKVINRSIQQFSAIGSGKFDVIDLDPFGSPQPYIHELLRLSRDGTILMITATDTAVLCGAHERACYKTYNSKPLHNELCKEAGIRILINYLARTASQFNYGIEVMLSVSSLHYMRIFVRLAHGSGNAVDSVKRTGLGAYCHSCKSFEVKPGIAPIMEYKCRHCRHPLDAFGPLWLGPLYKNEIVSEIKKSKRLSGGSQKIIDVISQEFDTPLFYSIPSMTRSQHMGSVSHLSVIERLRKSGFRASGTQFDPNGVKTDSGVSGVIRAMKSKAL
ncbi:MAG: hypothetical protein KGH72_04990 [Candidatus Micrarchaeota archaeon]|nr:hypothetical protein [Candidatus Micrarchaeota archaeon]